MARKKSPPSPKRLRRAETTRRAKRRENALERAAVTVVARLRDAGHETYFAGGCVRDRLLRLPVKEYDIATSAKPEEVERLFPRTIPVGKAFGVVLVHHGRRVFEVATFRRDLRYRDGRRPEGVRFTDAREDARRRDFTINGLFYDPAKKRVLDSVGGRRDLKNRVLRAIGDPRKRFAEDKLRLLRAVRFAVRFRLRVEPRTMTALRKMASKVTQVSAERIRDELVKMLLGPRPHEALDMLDTTGLLKAVLPEISAMKGVAQPPQYHPEGDVYIHTRIALRHFERSARFRSENERAELAMAVLLHDVGKPPTFRVAERIRFDGHAERGAKMARRIMRRLKFPRASVETVVAATRDHLKFMNVFDMRASTLKRFLREPHFPLLLELHRLDCLACHGDLSAHRFCVKRRREFAREKSLKPPSLISGDDLIRLGFTPGPMFKKILDRVETEQLEGRLSTKEQAVAFIRGEYPWG